MIRNGKYVILSLNYILVRYTECIVKHMCYPGQHIHNIKQQNTCKIHKLLFFANFKSVILVWKAIIFEHILLNSHSSQTTISMQRYKLV